MILPIVLPRALLLVGTMLGRPPVPESQLCRRAANVLPVSELLGHCFLFGGPYLPMGDASCTHCPGWQAVKIARKAHFEETRESLDHRTYYANHMRPSHVIWLE